MYNVKVIGGDQAQDGANGTPALISRQTVIGPCRVFSVSIFNTGPTQYYQIHDAGTSAPAEGSIPLMQIKVPTDSQGSFDFGDGRPFKAGVFICNSSTSGTKTLGANDSLISVHFRKTE